MELPKITVVVPSYNQGHFLGEALQSIVDQNYPNLELIVMDGGSNDDSVEVIRRFEPYISYWQSQPDGGQSAGINAGMERATGEIVCWLNSDDLFCPGALMTVGQAASRHPGFGLYIGNGLRLDQDTKVLAAFFPCGVALNRQALREGVNYILQPSAFFSRQAWKDVGGLDVDLHYVMDWDILIRIAAGHRAVLINELLAIAREYKETKTASGGIERAIEILQMCKKHTGQHVSVGASQFLLDALLQEGVCDHLGAGFHRHIMLARIEAARALLPLTCRKDGFPTESDVGDVTYQPELLPSLAGKAVPSRNDLAKLPTGRSVLTYFWDALPRTLLYRMASAPIMLGAMLKLTTPQTALERLRGVQMRKRKIQLHLSKTSKPSKTDR